MNAVIGKTLRTFLGKDFGPAAGFLAPALVILVLFVFYPLFRTIILSFSEWNLITDPNWVGLANYRSLFASGRFWMAFRVTVIFTVFSVGLTVVFGLIMALLIDSVGKRASRVYQTIFFLPTMISLVILATIWLYVLQPQIGPMNALLARLGLPRLGWLHSSQWALPSIIGMNVWRNSGYTMILFLAGLQGIPEQLYEVSRIDGASVARRIWSVTLPMLGPTTLFVLVVSVIRSFLVFTEVHVLTRGGPADSTLVMVYYIWQEGFRYYRAGNASAIATFFFVFVLIFSLVQMKLSERRTHYQGVK
ncbi:MAG: carbohydrate ABC transporter permease [Spirochaetota bacterium]